jgi:peptidoglycan/xylan/chitin deacetylase (PgdA/CDA1 family)
MSALLFHPDIEFDFARKKPKSKLPIQLLSFGCLLAIFVISLLGFANHPAQQITYSNSDQIKILSQYAHISQGVSIHTFVRTTNATAEESIPATPVVNVGTEVPILMYHYTPTNFELQLQHLQVHGYHTITMEELGRHLYLGSVLPAKPVVLTFDDGFLDQQKAFELLKRYQMKATFYLILGGEGSHYCIGLARTNVTCGDEYLNWGQAKNLIDSGLVEIGAHTINHIDLPNASTEQQWQEIYESKTRLEDMYNIPITTFAYPYGRYSPATVDLVAKAGFLTAVTTQSGLEQSSSNRYTMPRVRNALLLP